MTEPTDAELTECYKAANGEDVGKAQPLTTQRIFRAMRAAIAKWGTPPAVAGEPIGYLYCGGSYGDELADWEIVADQHQCDKLNEHHGSLGKEAKLPLYTTQQPTQAQAGAVVVTTDTTGRCVAVTRQDEEGRVLSVIWQAPEAQAGAVPLTDEQILNRENTGSNPGTAAYDLDLARFVEAAHGIKGGQHGPT